MADEKEKKTTTAKAPAKTVRRVRKTAQKAETVQKKPEVQKEERRMSQEALGMVETRGLVASIEAADSMLKFNYTTFIVSSLSLPGLGLARHIHAINCV